GHVRVPCAGPRPAATPARGGPGAAEPRHPRGSDDGTPTGPAAPTGHAHGTVDWHGSAPTRGERAPTSLVPGQGGAPPIENHDATHGGRSGLGSFAGPSGADGPYRPSPDEDGGGTSRKGTPLRGTEVPQGLRRRGGLSAWARRLAGGRGGPQETDDPEAYEDRPAVAQPEPPAGPPAAPDTWPDPAALLLTALGPGPRLWERGPGHSETLAVRLGTADRVAPDGSLLPAVPVTAGLREAGALGLAGPRPRLAGLARAVLAQLAALHSPDLLEIVLISTDRARSEEERVAEWSWLGWLPHLRPGHGQDCRLLLAHDVDQATARADELLRRLDDRLADGGAAPAPVPAPRGT
ncbi:hypothetical protein ACFT0E_38575, partial [Streptomyces sp. NPDC057052]